MIIDEGYIRDIERFSEVFISYKVVFYIEFLILIFFLVKISYLLIKCFF